jgi:hypothetical protein
MVIGNTNALASVILCGSGTALIYNNPALLEVTHFDSDKDANKREETVRPERTGEAPVNSGFSNCH